MQYKDPKIIYGIAGLIVFLLLFIPIKNTIGLARKFSALQQAVSKLDLHASPIRHNFTERSMLDQVDDGFRKIVGAVSWSSQAHHVTIKRFDPPQYVSDEEVRVQHQQIMLEGAFVDILKCLQAANDTLTNVKITAVRFDLEERNKKTSLQAKVVYQSVKISAEHE